MLGLGELRKEVEDIKKEVRKTEYEKIREPLEEVIVKLEHENYMLEQNMDNMIRAFKELINDIDKNNLRLLIHIDQPIISEYTRDNAPFIEPQIVYLPLNKIAVTQLKETVQKAIDFLDKR